VVLAHCATAYLGGPARARGLGADDMEVTSAGLRIASDDQNGVNKCGGVSGRAGISPLPHG
jgi:hypothetical protein